MRGALNVVLSIAVAVFVALAGAVMALLALWPSSDPEPVVRTDLIPAVSQGMGYGPQCSQLYNTIEHTWTESQWTVWESLKRDLGC